MNFRDEPWLRFSLLKTTMILEDFLRHHVKMSRCRAMKVVLFQKFTVCSVIEMGVSKNRGTPKWMVDRLIMENPIKMDDLGIPLFSETSI